MHAGLARKKRATPGWLLPIHDPSGARVKCCRCPSGSVITQPGEVDLNAIVIWGLVTWLSWAAESQPSFIA